MSELKTIPSNPRYKITREGDVVLDTVDRSTLTPYLGRGNVQDEKHLRVRLRDHRNYPIAIAVEDLLAETFPDYVRPDRNVPVEEVEEDAKPKKKYQRLTDREVVAKTRKQGITYSEEELKGKEFRAIPGFPGYKITADGILYGTEKGLYLRPSVTKAGSKTYHLYGEGRVKTTRTAQGLADLAFPELAKEQPKDKRFATSNQPPVYKPKGDWRIIPGFPSHRIHADGVVKYATQRHLIKVRTNPLNNEKYIVIRDADGSNWPVAINDLLDLAFPQVSEKVAA